MIEKYFFWCDMTLPVIDVDEIEKPMEKVLGYVKKEELKKT